MTRDEVLDAVELAACEHDAHAVGLRLVDKVLAAKWHECESEKLRAAAEIIRESGWRPIAEAPENTYLTVGIYASFGWYEATVERDKKSAMRDGYTHFYIKPAPPAREVEND